MSTHMVSTAVGCAAPPWLSLPSLLFASTASDFSNRRRAKRAAHAPASRFAAFEAATSGPLHHRPCGRAYSHQCSALVHRPSSNCRPKRTAPAPALQFAVRKAATSKFDISLKLFLKKGSFHECVGIQQPSKSIRMLMLSQTPTNPKIKQ